MSLAVLHALPTATPRSLVLFLQQLPGFERVDDNSLGQLASSLEVRRLRRGQSVWHAGDPARELMFLRSGVIWVHQALAGSREVSLGYFGRGFLLGLHAWGAAEWPDDADAHEDSTVLVVRRSAFEAWLAQTPAAVSAVVRMQADQGRRMQRRLELVCGHGARARLIGLLLDLSDQFGVRDSRGTIIDLRLTHREMAALIGATRETVSVAVVELRKAGLLRTEQRRVIVLDRGALRALVEEA